jgi:adenylate cyclase
MRLWPARRSEPPAARTGPRLRVRLLVGALIGLAGLLLDQLGDGVPALRRLELLTLDWRFQLRGPRAPGPEVLLVMIDDASVEALGKWPPSRDAITDGLNRLTAAGARLVVLNLLLAEPAPSLPPAAREALLEALPLLPARSQRLRDAEALLAQDLTDTRLGTAIAEADRVILPYAFVFDPASANIGGVPPWIAATAYRTVLHREQAAGGPVPEPRGLLTLAAGLAALGSGQGHVNLFVDSDGALRFDLPAIHYGEEQYPSLAIEAARLYLGLAREQLVLWLGEGVALGQRWLPTDRRTRLLVDHYGPQGTFPTVSFVDLLQGRLDPALVEDRLVIIGGSAAATGDRFTTPFGGRLSGSEHIATAIDNILHGRVLRQDGAIHTTSSLATLALALTAALLAGRWSLMLSLAVTLGLAAVWGVIAFAGFAAHVWLSLVVPSLAVLVAGGTLEALRAGMEQRRRRRLERQRLNLARYFPPAVVDRLAASDQPSGLERTQEAAVMFVDMIGFTQASEELAPAQAMSLLRAFHGRVERAVFAHGGMVDKFIGDGALACFGVPDVSPSAAADALRAATHLHAAIADWNVERVASGNPPLGVAVGIHYGPVLMGDIGGERQFQFTVVGDTVNVASRLEALTREVGAAILVSDAVVDQVREADAAALLAGFEPLPTRQLRGREGLLRLWSLPRQGARGPGPDGAEQTRQRAGP